MSAGGPAVPVQSARPVPKLAVLGALLAIAITTTMDMSGLAALSALPLIPLMAIFWYVERLSRREMGFTWGGRRDYGLAVAYPLVLLGAVTLIAAAAGAIDSSQADWRKAGMNLALHTVSTFVMAIITEEGFFRGWLWASLERAGQSATATLVWSSVAFSLWHLSAALLPTDYAPARAQVPVYMVNAAVMGAVWGLLRLISASVIVSSLSHAVWNGITYVLFGFGTQAGALGIAQTALYGPEVGVLGLGLNVIFAAVLWRWWRAHGLEAVAVKRSAVERNPTRSL